MPLRYKRPGTPPEAACWPSAQAAGALVYTGRNFTLSRRTFELTEQGQVTDRYTKAIEQLGSGKFDVRIGAVYALERIADDSAKDHPTVMEVLAAFIRVHSREPSPPGADEPGTDESPRTTHPDVQAAMTVIVRRDSRRDRQRIDLTGANLTSADLTGPSRHGGSEVTIFGARVEIPGPGDLNQAVLTGANLTGADLSRVQLTGANLTGANLTGANLTSAELFGANLTGANLTGADLTSADLTSADLTSTDLFAADLTGTAWPSDEVLPEGWQRDTDSGRLERLMSNSGGEPTDAASGT